MHFNSDWGQCSWKS